MIVATKNLLKTFASFHHRVVMGSTLSGQQNFRTSSTWLPHQQLPCPPAERHPRIPASRLSARPRTPPNTCHRRANWRAPQQILPCLLFHRNSNNQRPSCQNYIGNQFATFNSNKSPHCAKTLSTQKKRPSCPLTSTAGTRSMCSQRDTWQK